MNRDYGTPIPPPARALLRSSHGGRRTHVRHRGRLFAILGIGAGVLLTFGVLAVSFSTAPPSVTVAATTFRNSGFGRLAFDAPDGWSADASDERLYGPLILYAPIRSDINLPPVAIRFDATIADPARLTACGVQVTNADGSAGPTPAPGGSTEKTLNCLIEGLLASGMGGRALPAPDSPPVIFTYGAAMADTGLGHTALEMRWTSGQVPWSPAVVAAATPIPSPAGGIVIPSNVAPAPLGPADTYPQVGGIAIDPGTGGRYEMEHLMAVYLPRAGSFNGPDNSRRFLVVTMSYPATLAPDAIAGLEAIFLRLTRSLSFV